MTQLNKQRIDDKHWILLVNDNTFLFCEIAKDHRETNKFEDMHYCPMCDSVFIDHTDQ